MRRRLGQHFLKNKKKIKQLVSALDLKKRDIVIEIGPGHGEVTKEIIHHDAFKNLVLIERDETLAVALKQKFSGDGRIGVVPGDALKTLSQLIQGLALKPYKLVGNIPFYITGRLLRTLSELEHKPTVTVLGIQKEVAERISAQPPRMNLLAASVQFWADTQIIATISRTNYRPQPEVDGAVVKLATKELTTEESENYYKFIKVLFKQPRKTILNNLSAEKEMFNLDKSDIIKKLNGISVKLSDRPQNLGLDLLTTMSKLFL